MKFTLSWLKDHLDTDAGLDEIAAKLVMLGIEVEHIADRAKELAPFKVAYVRSAEPHPNADKLRVCIVETADSGTVQVVCGAPNARTGMKGVFAPVGSTIPRTGLVLKQSMIRGVASNGMLCSEYEMGISDDHEGIIDLPEDAPVGAPFAVVAGLDDPVIDVKVTPNRADCLGVRGIARDLAAAGLGTLKSLAVEKIPGRFPSLTHVHVASLDEAACPLFVGRTIRNVRNGPSPQWLQDRLLAIGLRPISALVDITNFLTFDLDRPLHVFDVDKVDGDLIVRNARPGETLLALNGREYALDPEMTVIADSGGVESLGGVIGGEETGCTEATTTVFVEAALFDPVRTAATGRKLNLQSDARYRFERGLDPAFVFDGMEIATRMILDLCGGEASEITVAGAEPNWRRTLAFRPERVRTLGGVHVPAAESRRILIALGCGVGDSGDADGTLAVTPPSWRGDIEGEADLVEEVLRIRGYDEIPAVPLDRDTPLPRPSLTPGQRRIAHLRRALAARGLVEAVTFSFIPKGQAELFGGAPPELHLVNPISADLDVMRPSVLPNLLDAARRNADRGIADAALFEVGPQYRDDTPEGQATVAAGVRVGRTGPKHWADPGAPVDAFTTKADALAALAAAGAPVDNLQITADPPAWYHPGRAGTIRLGAVAVGYFGEVHPAVLRAIDLRGPAAAFEIFPDLVPLPRAKAVGGRTRPLLKLSPFQPVERDYAFVVERDLPAETLLRAARGVDRKLVTGVRLFDVYEGTGLPEAKKSLAITVTLQPQEATLTDEQIEAFAQKLITAVQKATGGELRR
jgi:phenylalanyl-tRNA synthetase beta chain